MEARNTKKAEDSDITKSWSDLIAALLKLTYQKPDVVFKEGAKDGENVDLCLSEHFIESQITNISLYDQSGNEHKIINLSDANIPDNPVRIVIHIDHMNLEYIPADKAGHETLSITGQEYDIYSSDDVECYIAGREKAKAALNLAYAAQAMGWTEVDLGHTNDPMDRMFLMKACKHVGLNYGDEEWTASVVPGTQILQPDFLKSAAIQKAIQDIKSENGKANPAILALNRSFEKFFESPKSSIPRKTKPVAAEIPSNMYS